MPGGSARPFPILLYHSLSREATPGYRSYAIDPGQFREQMEAIASGGYRTLTVRQLAVHLAGPLGGVPERTVLITFDDGFDDIHREALPILDRLGLAATAFVVSGLLGGTSRWLTRDGEGDRRLLSWAQVRELAGAGIEIGSHSLTHPQLDILPISFAEDEIRSSRAVLEDGLGSSVSSFAYPYGYHTEKLKALLHRHGYTAGCAVKQALSHEHDDSWALGRALVSPGLSNDRFASWLEGRGLPVAWPGEHPQTVAWRWVRRISRRIPGSGPRPGSAASA